MQMRLFNVFVFGFLVGVSVYGTAHAQALEGGDGLEHTFASYLRYAPGRSVNAMSGEVEITDTAMEYTLDVKAFGKLPVCFGIETQYIGIDDTLADVELPSHLVGVSMDVETTFPFFAVDKTYVRFGISPSFYADDWDCPSSAFRVPSRFLLIHLPNDRLTLLAGIAVYPDYEDEVVPVFGFVYKPNERLSLHIVPKRPNISYLLSEKLTLFVEGGLGSSEFEVTRDSDKAKNAVLRYKESRVGTGIKFTPVSFMQGSVSFGGVFNRSLKYRDGQGKVIIKDGWYSELRMEIKL